ncbi:class I SAM-dependent methyltransferase [Microbacterium esteraromaticum]|uniref:class I SAM-dependent methyltransferase n=1 Tax=Microbacterium esteraromaticum TaxID=57043 RepID=UPI0028F6CE23|nr:class I SAM-dependent methyltransferase [Microbacterium esteraromaticum]
MSWAGTGDAYAASYAQLCAGTGEVLRAHVGVPGGRSLLDVGAGDGTLAAAWSDAGWRVTAAEPEASMRRVAKRQHPTLTITADALPALSFDDGAFDVVVANFVLNHVSDPSAAASELRRVAAGTVAASIWSASPASLWGEVTTRAGVMPLAGARLPADKDFERTASGFERMLRGAGWEPVVTEHTWTWRPTPEMLWRSVVGGVAGAGALYATLSDADRRRYRQAFDAVIDERRDGEVIPHVQTAAVAVDHRGGQAR